MFKIKSNVSNLRPAKTEEAIVSTTATHGNIKLNTNAARMLGLKSGDRVNIVEAEDGLYIHKSWEGLGNKVAATSESGSGTLTFSTAAAWQMLGGNEDTKKQYKISEDVVQTVSDADIAAMGEDGEKYRGVPFFKLAFVGEEAKQERKKKETA